MPLTNFICPDTVKIPVTECLNQCRMEIPCMSLSSRTSAGYDRPYKGVSPSMISTGAYEVYLSATEPYSIRPTDSVWAILGTRVHAGLEQFGDEKFNEVELTYASEKLNMHGTTDLLIPGVDGFWEIWDYKVAGSYKAMQYLGITKGKETVLDHAGNPVVYKSGKKKGEIKTKNKFTQSKKDVSIYKETLQLNMYRIMAVQSGFPVRKMFIEAIIRDGGLQMASSRGVTKTSYVIPIKPMDDNKVVSLYEKKQKSFDAAFKAKDAPKCSKEETWDGVKCKGYCDVRDICKYNEE